MDDATKRAYIDTRLAKARDDLMTARDNLQQGQQNASWRAWNAICGMQERSSSTTPLTPLTFA